MLIRFCFLIVIYFSILHSFPLKAQDDCIFEHLSTEDGLSNGSVSAMLKDKSGFMWFATWDGINRFDGHTFKVYKSESYGTGKANAIRIEHIFQDSLGNVWVITRDLKAFKLDRFSETLKQYPDYSFDKDTAKISSIVPFANGDVWLRSDNAGAFRLRSDSIKGGIVHLYKDASLTLPSNKIGFIFSDSESNIWINTAKGIRCFDKDVKAINEALVREINSKYLITARYHMGSLIIFGTKNGKILILNLPKKEFVEADLTIDNAVLEIESLSNGTLFIATSGSGILEFSLWKHEVVYRYSQPEILQVLNLYLDSKNRLWIESNESGISKINTDKRKFSHYIQKLDVNPDVRPEAQCGIMEDENGIVWMSLKGGGFGYYNENTDEVAYFYNEPGVKSSRLSNFVKCFYKDPSGILWMSTYFKGVEKITFIQEQFKYIQPAPQLNLSIANEVRALLCDNNNCLWVATKKHELFILDQDYNVIRQVNSVNGVAIGMVYAMLKDAQGNIYLGTKGNGLFVLRPNQNGNLTGTHYLNNSADSTSLSDNNIYALFQDRQGRIWVGTFGGGVNLFVEGEFLHSKNQMRGYPKDKSRVRSITQDKDGNIWFGTTTGIVLFKQTLAIPSEYDFSTYSLDQQNVKGIRNDDIFWIYCDPKNRVWMAPMGSGLALLNSLPADNSPLSFTCFSKPEGLSGDVVYTITSDNQDNIWLSTEHGITFYNPENKVFKNYGPLDGIINPAFSEGALATMANGDICFGGNKGLYAFNPINFKHNQQKVDLLITGFQLFGKEVEPGSESVLKQSIIHTHKITLKHNQNIFGFTIAAMDFKIKDKIQLAYMLQGYDEDWIYLQNNNQVNYTRVPPGKYIFKIRFVNPELQELNQPQEIQLTILPPWWQTIWAYLGYFVFLLILFFVARKITITIIRLRNKVVIEKELTELKLNFFTNISHELRTPLTLILSPARELLAREQLGEKGKAYTRLIEQNAQRLLRLVNQLLDFRKIERDKMELSLQEVDIVWFVKTVTQNFNNLAAEKSIRFMVEANQPSIIGFVDQEKIDSILYNLLSNAFKYTPDHGQINLWLNKINDQDRIEILVQDTGPGVSADQQPLLFKLFASNLNAADPKKNSSGIGLALSKELALLHHGDLIYQSSPAGGALFKLTMAISQFSMTDKEVKTESPTEFIKKQGIARSTEPLTEGAIVLIVEDNTDLRKFIRSQLSPTYRVAEAGDGYEGLKLALKLQPDIIISDVMMPLMDGIQLLEKLKNNFETSHIPVILLSAKSSIESRIEGLRYGADAYMTKPFNNEQLLVQIENLLKQRLLLRQRFASQPLASNHKPDLSITDKDNEFLNQVRSLIEDNLSTESFRLEDLYKALGMGRSKFFDKMKGLTGLSPVDFVKEYKLNKAQSLLQNTSLNVSEVAFASGFTDAGYFSKCFKERFGISPSDAVRSNS